MKYRLKWNIFVVNHVGELILEQSTENLEIYKRKFLAFFWINQFSVNQDSSYVFNSLTSINRKPKFKQ